MKATFNYYCVLLCTLLGIETAAMRAERVARMQRAIDNDRARNEALMREKTERNTYLHTCDARARKMWDNGIFVLYPHRFIEAVYKF